MPEEKRHSPADGNESFPPSRRILWPSDVQPAFQPKGWLLIANAIDQAGMHTFEDGWDTTESLNRKGIGIDGDKTENPEFFIDPDYAPGGHCTPRLAEKRLAAGERFFQVAQKLRPYLHNGRIQTATFEPGLTLVDNDMWADDLLFLRAVRDDVHPLKPPFGIFVEWPSFVDVLYSIHVPQSVKRGVQPNLKIWFKHKLHRLEDCLSYFIHSIPAGAHTQMRWDLLGQGADRFDQLRAAAIKDILSGVLPATKADVSYWIRRQDFIDWASDKERYATGIWWLETSEAELSPPHEAPNRQPSHSPQSGRQVSEPRRMAGIPKGYMALYEAHELFHAQQDEILGHLTPGVERIKRTGGNTDRLWDDAEQKEEEGRTEARNRLFMDAILSRKLRIWYREDRGEILEIPSYRFKECQDYPEHVLCFEIFRGFTVDLSDPPESRRPTFSGKQLLVEKAPFLDWMQRVLAGEYGERFDVSIACRWAPDPADWYAAPAHRLEQCIHFLMNKTTRAIQDTGELEKFLSHFGRHDEERQKRREAFNRIRDWAIADILSSTLRATEADRTYWIERTDWLAWAKAKGLYPNNIARLEIEAPPAHPPESPQICEEHQPDSALTGLLMPKHRHVTGKTLKKWYLEDYLAEHQNDVPHPSREVDLEAAKGAFPGKMIDRNALRRLRNEYAPARWSKSGPKSNSGGSLGRI